MPLPRPRLRRASLLPAAPAAIALRNPTRLLRKEMLRKFLTLRTSGSLSWQRPGCQLSDLGSRWHQRRPPAVPSRPRRARRRPAAHGPYERTLGPVGTDSPAPGPCRRHHPRQRPWEILATRVRPSAQGQSADHGCRRRGGHRTLHCHAACGCLFRGTFNRSNNA